MGLWDRFKRKNHSIERISSLKHNILKSFVSLRNDLDNQNKWINYLYKNHTDVKSDHKSHKYDIKNQLNKVNQWIDYLHDNSKETNKRLKDIEKDIKSALDTYNRHIIELYKVAEKTSNIKHVDEHKLKSALKTTVSADVKDELRQVMLKEVRSHIKDEIQQLSNELEEIKNKAEKAAQKTTQLSLSQNKSIAPIEPEIKVVEKVVKQPEIRYHHSPLTNPEQKLLNILFTDGEAISYDKVARITGQSINTVRVNMNSLKKKGLIEENLLPTGIKLFSLKNKERIKKIYNIEVL